MLTLVLGLLLQEPVAAPDFGRDVRPILATHCFQCHGPDAGARKAGLRLDRREGATSRLASGHVAFAPGQPEASAALLRLTSDDARFRMPPPSQKKRPSAAEVESLRRWVTAGAAYAPHWALVPPRRAAPPVPHDISQVRNDIDRFVQARLEREGLRPQPEADRETLIRRASLDLIGLPPTLAEIDAFLADGRPDAYERVVDRLLASPHYGERWARRWLDLARYADTNGYEKDRPRSMWPWRDWVIRAINDDLPFDRFTIEQLAGDLLPGATPDQIVATGFHRNTMLNEEGGIDVEEFRMAAVVDRVATTGTAWLGMTLGCAQCHDHKYDPVTHEEFWRLAAVFDNCDERTVDVRDAGVEAERQAQQRRIDALRDSLAERFPLPAPRWQVVAPQAASSRGGATLSLAAPDGSVRAKGEQPAKDSYTLELVAPESDLACLRLEALVDHGDPRQGPGRTGHGNFVLSELRLFAEDARGQMQPVYLVSAQADFSQAGWPVAAAIDGKPETGWGIHGVGPGWRRDRAAWFEAAAPFARQGGRLRLELDQDYGSAHTLLRFRVSVGARREPAETLAAERRAAREAAFADWLDEARRAARPWRLPSAMVLRSAGGADFRRLDDGSVLLYGNNPDRDTTEIELSTDPGRVAAFKLEALPHASLPGGGPGRSPFFPEAGFVLSDVQVRVEPGLRRLAIASASPSHASQENPIERAFDADPDSSWNNSDRPGKPVSVVFRLAAPVDLAPGERLVVTLCQHSIHNNNLGRFRLSLTGAEDATALPIGLEQEALLGRGPPFTAQERAGLEREFLATTPQLASAQAEIDAAIRALPRHPTTLVLQERDAARRRATRLRQRGEFTSPRQVVEPGVPASLPPLPPGVPTDRLALARWLVSPQNPLTARVTVNRWWEAFFGRGLVRTGEDFGVRGDEPSHPELLDWLATELVRRGWSRQAMHRLIVTSAAYRRRTVASSEDVARDPDNVLLARGARLRLDAELVRDLVLRASDLLVPRIGGPSVFPPQPDGVFDFTYGGSGWPTSQGDDRYRRGLYTHQKRSAPYAMFALFDAPSGEACLPRRERSNTPLQALALLNHEVFLEAAQALARSLLARPLLDDAARLEEAFRRCTGRRPPADESRALLAFLDRQRQRFERGELGAAAVAGAVPKGVDPSVLAAWTCLVRVLFNLDETMTRS